MIEASWIDPNRVVTADPGPRDSFVVTLVDGKRVAVESVEVFGQALNRAKALARGIKPPVKLLPMQLGELLGFMGLDKIDMTKPSPNDAELYQLAVTTCREVILNCNDGAVRREAHATLVCMGEAL